MTKLETETELEFLPTERQSLEMARQIRHEWGITCPSVLQAIATPESISLPDTFSLMLCAGDTAKLVSQVAGGPTLMPRIEMGPNDYDLAMDLLSQCSNLPAVVLSLAQFARRIQTYQEKSAPLLSEKELNRLSQEARIYAAMAKFLGLYPAVVTIEETAFQLSRPQEYAAISANVKELYQRPLGNSETYRLAIEYGLRDLCTEMEIPLIRLDSRTKQESHIQEKVQRKKLDITDLTDITGLRIVVPTASQAQKILEELKNMDGFEIVEKETNDYISYPKPSGYQALHVALRYHSGACAEVQIMTSEMYVKNTFGSASHFKAYAASGKTGVEQTLSASYQRAIINLAASLSRGENTTLSVRLRDYHAVAQRKESDKPRPMSYEPRVSQLKEQLERLELLESQPETETPVWATPLLIVREAIEITLENISSDNLIAKVLQEKMKEVDGAHGLHEVIQLAAEMLCFTSRRQNAIPEDIIFSLYRRGFNPKTFFAMIAQNIAGISNTYPEDERRRTVKEVDISDEEEPTARGDIKEFILEASYQYVTFQRNKENLAKYQHRLENPPAPQRGRTCRQRQLDAAYWRLGAKLNY